MKSQGISGERLAWHNKGLADGKRGVCKPPFGKAAHTAYMTGWRTGNDERKKASA